jgi:hypothetical protein
MSFDRTAKITTTERLFIDKKHHIFFCLAIRNEIPVFFSTAKWFRTELRAFLSCAEWFGTEFKALMSSEEWLGKQFHVLFGIYLAAPPPPLWRHYVAKMPLPFIIS